jgi:hypothetical protein
MKPHVRIYLKHFGYGEQSYIPCEICGKRSNDLHHIDARGMGATNQKNDISNLMALCREHHLELGDKKQHMEYLKSVHEKYLKNKVVKI